MHSELRVSKLTKTMVMIFVVSAVVFLYSLVPPPDPKSYVGVWTQYEYQLLTRGFLNGQLSLPVLPPQALLKASNPYDPKQNDGYRQLFDASFYKGKFYLYFGPLPLLFFIPYYFLIGKLATSHAAVLFFLSLGFACGFYLLTKIKFKFFPQISSAQLILAGLTLGICNNGLYLIARPSVYEIAIASAFCAMNFALFFLYKIFNENFKIKDVLLFSTSLALCVAGRPNFALACFCVVPILLIFFIKKSNGFKLSLAFLTPMLLVGFSLAIYNYLRFDSFFDFGIHYQIADENRVTSTHLQLSYHNILPGLYSYLVLNPNSWPWTTLTPDVIKWQKYWRIFDLSHYYVGYVRGVFLATPLSWFIFAFPLLIIQSKYLKCKPLINFMNTTLLVVAVLLLSLSLLGGATQRYMTDFQPYIVLLSILTAWMLAENATNRVVKKIIQGLLVSSELASLYLTFTV